MEVVVFLGELVVWTCLFVMAILHVPTDMWQQTYYGGLVSLMSLCVSTVIIAWRHDKKSGY